MLTKLLLATVGFATVQAHAPAVLYFNENLISKDELDFSNPIFLAITDLFKKLPPIEYFNSSIEFASVKVISNKDLTVNAGETKDGAAQITFSGTGKLSFVTHQVTFESLLCDPQTTTISGHADASFKLTVYFDHQQILDANSDPLQIIALV